MRILLVNKFYYRRGGDCVVVQRTEAMLRQHGHEVAVFAMDYPLNDPSPWSKYFASQVDFDSGRVKGFMRMMGHGDIVPAFKRMLDDFKPDVVHLHNIHSYISPVVARLAHEQGCRVVWTMHDYKLICPGYTCTRDDAACHACFQRKWNVILHKCMRGSKLASIAAYLEARKWNRDRLQQWVDRIICPSHYMAKCMHDAGFADPKVSVLTNCVDQLPGQIVTERDDYYCYAGRLSSEKGVDNLLEVAQKLPMHLKVAGTGPLEQPMRERYAQCGNIEFLGQLDREQVSDLLAHARFSVMPSEWPENNPLSVIESLCLGTPVVGTHMGGIPELIDYSNGIVARPMALATALEQAYMRTWDYQEISRDAVELFDPELHYARLMKIYGE